MANAGQFQDLTAPLTAVIANGTNASAVIDLRGGTLVGIQIPSVMTSTTLTFKVAAVQGDTPSDLYNSNSAQVSITIPTASARSFALDPSTFAGWNFVQVVSSSNEGADRSLKLVTRPI